MLKNGYGNPSIRVSYFGIEDMAEALYSVARHFGEPEMLDKARLLVKEGLVTLLPELAKYKEALAVKNPRRLPRRTGKRCRTDSF